MRDLVFYEKPGCMGNRRQRKLLEAASCRLQVRDLLTEHWTAESLLMFFAGLPVTQWFNTSAPRIKSGEIDIDAVDEQQALAMMLEEPLLIRRPLMQYGNHYQAGFEDGPVLTALGIRLNDDAGLDGCVHTEAASAGGAS